MPASATEQADNGVAVPVAVGVVVAAIVAVVAAVGLVVSLTEDRLPSGPELAPPPPPAPTVIFDSQTGQASFEQVTVTMPRVPYECPSRSAAAPPILDSGVICHVTVHAKYNRTDDWSATAVFGSVAAGMTGASADATGEQIFERWQDMAFDHQNVTVTDKTAAELQLGGRHVVVVSGNVHYSVPELSSRYDRVLVVVLPLDDRGYAVYLSSRPNDTPQPTLDVLNASINTLNFSR